MTDDDRGVVVGYDGSACSREALHRAVDEARRRWLPLRVVSVSGWAPYGPPVALGRVVAEPDPHEVGERVAAQGRALAQRLAPGLAVSTAVHSTLGAAEALVRESARAELVVVGSRGRGGFTGLVLGSTSTGVAMHASCPVLVVRHGHDGVPTGPVVVGVDGSALSGTAVRWAFEAAAERGAGLTAVHAWQPPWALQSEWVVPDPDEWDALAQSAAAVLAEALAACSREHPGVVVERRVVRAHPGHALADASRGAQLLVVGGRGLGGFRGLLLGSVSQAALHHAACPVAVVHGGGGDHRGTGRKGA